MLTFSILLCSYKLIFRPISGDGPVAQWIRHLTTDQGIPGSSPGRVVFYQFLFSFFLPFSLLYSYFYCILTRILAQVCLKFEKN